MNTHQNQPSLRHPLSKEEEIALSEAPEVPRLTEAELEDLWREIQESRRLQAHLSRVERVAELQREKKEGY